MSKLFDAVEAAEYLGLNPQTVRRFAVSGKVPAFKVGKKWRFDSKVLEDWAKDSSSGFVPQKGVGSEGDIVVIDDEASVREYLELGFHDIGLEVKTFPGGKSALKEVTSRPRMLLVDLAMPDMSGPEVIEEIHNRWGSVPTVIITGYPDSELMEAALRFSPVTLLAKPFSVPQLHACVSPMLSIS